MAEPAEPRTDHPYERMRDASLRAAAKIYIERLAYTTRGNFAFVVGLLYTIYYNVSYLVEAGTMEITTPMLWGKTHSIFGFVAIISDIGLKLLGGILFGILILLLLDIYEHHIGLSIETEA